MKKFRLLPLLCLALAAGVCGCSNSVTQLDERDRGDYIVKQAMVLKNNGDIKGALKRYADAIDRSPKLAAAHLDVAIIFHDYTKDYLRAIYHYQRYLELRPTTEKKTIIEDRIRLAGQAYATRLVSDGSVVAELGRLSGALSELKKENDALKNSLRQASLQLEQAKSRPVQPEATVPSTRVGIPIQDAEPARLTDAAARTGRQTTPVPPAGGATALVSRAAAAKPDRVRTYKVKRGDTLRGIAMEFYRDPAKMDAIVTANRDKLGTARSLKEGQVLVLP